MPYVDDILYPTTPPHPCDRGLPQVRKTNVTPVGVDWGKIPSMPVGAFAAQPLTEWDLRMNDLIVRLIANGHSPADSARIAKEAIAVLKNQK